MIVCIRTGQPEWRDRTHHQPRVEGTKGRIINAQFGHARRRIIMDQNVRPLHEPGEFRELVFLLRKINRYTALVGIEV